MLGNSDGTNIMNVINLDHDGFKSGIQWLFQVMMNVENTIIQSTIEPKILYLNHRKIKFE